MRLLPLIVLTTALIWLPNTCTTVLAVQENDTTQTEAKPQEETQTKKPKREPIYDEEADATHDIETALAKAKKENRRVLIQWGANWCGWCYLLHDLMDKDAAIRRELMYEYDVVLVDIGQSDKNKDLIEKYKADIAKQGVPFLTILDADGNVVVNQETSSLESKEEGKHEHVPEAVLEFLTKYQASAQNAEDVVAAGIAEAKSNDRIVFLHFGAPWCGWCHYLENWMAGPKVNELLSRVFVDVKVDTDRMDKGQDTLTKYCSEQSGIPWFVFLDGEGHSVADSTGPGGNVGFPSTDEEIAHFVTMLESTKRFSEDEIQFLSDSLVENRKAREAKRAAGNR
ncbi:MAG: thioredoxin family protein [Pirellulaceae bacterium]